MRILITGGTGFIGSHLTAGLIKAGHEVTTVSRSAKFAYPEAFDSGEQELVRSITCDIMDRDRLEPLLAESDVLIHNAAAVGVAESSLRMRQFIEANIIGMATIVDILKQGKHSIRKVLLGSSISVYGEGYYRCPNCGIVRPLIRIKMLEILQRNDWNPPCSICGRPVEPIDTPETAERLGESVYSITKKTQEDLLVSTCHLLDIPAVIFRYCTVYGPGQSANNPYSRMISAMFDRVRPIITEDGKQSRDFIHVKDVVAANLLALQNDVEGSKILNIGSGNQIPLIDFLLLARQQISRLCGVDDIYPEVSNLLVPGEIRHCYADCNRMESFLNLQPKIGLESGVEDLVKWLLHRRSV
jgi:dTDP-L-rhamnose 4-epimerase